MKKSIALFATLATAAAFAEESGITVDYKLIPTRPLMSRIIRSDYDQSIKTLSVKAESVTMRIEPDGRRNIVINVPGSSRDILMVDTNAEDAMRAARFVNLLIEEQLLTQLSLGTLQEFLVQNIVVNPKNVTATVAGRKVELASLYKTLAINERGEMILSPATLRESLKLSHLTDEEIAEALKRPQMRDQLQFALKLEEEKAARSGK